MIRRACSPACCHAIFYSCWCILHALREHCCRCLRFSFTTSGHAADALFSCWTDDTTYSVLLFFCSTTTDFARTVNNGCMFHFADFILLPLPLPRVVPPSTLVGPVAARRRDGSVRCGAAFSVRTRLKCTRASAIVVLYCPCAGALPFSTFGGGEYFAANTLLLFLPACSTCYHSAALFAFSACAPFCAVLFLLPCCLGGGDWTDGACCNFLCHTILLYWCPAVYAAFYGCTCVPLCSSLPAAFSVPPPACLPRMVPSHSRALPCKFIHATVYVVSFLLHLYLLSVYIVLLLLFYLLIFFWVLVDTFSLSSFARSFAVHSFYLLLNIPFLYRRCLPVFSSSFAYLLFDLLFDIFYPASMFSFMLSFGSFHRHHLPGVPQHLPIHFAAYHTLLLPAISPTLVLLDVDVTALLCYLRVNAPPSPVRWALLLMRVIL